MNYKDVTHIKLQCSGATYITDYNYILRNNISNTRSRDSLQVSFKRCIFVAHEVNKFQLFVDPNLKPEINSLFELMYRALYSSLSWLRCYKNRLIIITV